MQAILTHEKTSEHVKKVIAIYGITFIVQQIEFMDMRGFKLIVRQILECIMKKKNYPNAINVGIFEIHSLNLC